MVLHVRVQFLNPILHCLKMDCLSFSGAKNERPTAKFVEYPDQTGVMRISCGYVSGRTLDLLVDF